MMMMIYCHDHHHHRRRRPRHPVLLYLLFSPDDDSGDDWMIGVIFIFGLLDLGVALITAHYAYLLLVVVSKPNRHVITPRDHALPLASLRVHLSHHHQTPLPPAPPPLVSPPTSPPTY